MSERYDSFGVIRRVGADKGWSHLPVPAVNNRGITSHLRVVWWDALKRKETICTR